MCFSLLELTFKRLDKGNKHTKKEKEPESVSLGVVGEVPGGTVGILVDFSSAFCTAEHREEAET